jgi:hypothetical protein
MLIYGKLKTSISMVFCQEKEKIGCFKKAFWRLFAIAGHGKKKYNNSINRKNKND